MARIRTEFGDLLKRVLIPGLATILPLKWCVGPFKILVLAKSMYRESRETALGQASLKGWADHYETYRLRCSKS